MDILDLISLLIFLSAAFTLVNITYLKLPHTIGLMAIALVMSVVILLLGLIFPSVSDLAIHIMEEFDFKEVLLNVMLSFLLFAGAMSINLRMLLQEKWPILILATIGVLVSTFIVGTLMYYAFTFVGFEITLVHCYLFGALISPTDPIAVLALVKKANLSKNLEIKIAGESLFNDGIGVVVFLTIMGIDERGGADSFDALEVAGLFAREVIGGLGIGAVFGYMGLKLLDFIDNDHVELEVLVTLSMVLVCARLSEMLHVSGPLAMVIMGLFVGNEGRGDEFASATGEYVYKFWHLLDESLNAILFILVGFEMIVISQSFVVDYFALGLMSISIVLAARFIGVALPIGIMKRFRHFEKNTVAILTWGGLRGGLSVAMALSLPDSIAEKDLILSCTYCVVVFSILVQGLTIGKLIKS
ncbi:MAG: sodium:proton antiporter [Imperialibacter sp.]|uniref:cation:proton antiporter n=1 Tax=Imperialibacter sp. TaxID=2038411 RepID=UPI0032EAD007